MTRFSSWPRWAVDALRAVLVRVPVMPGVLFDLDVEVYSRELSVAMSEVQDANEKPGWWCPGSKGDA